MLNLEMLLVITNRDISENYVSLLGSHGIHLTLAALGKGTASKEILSMFAFEETGKAILLSISSSDKIKAAVNDLQRKFLIKAPGTGIVLTIPLNAVGGTATAHYLADETVIERKEYAMSTEESFDLIYVITNEGYSSLVMDAAKEKGGATGGTVIHARGVGTEQAKKFFGISISDEKEILLIACRSHCRNRIMQAIINETGLNTKARSLVFSVPVSSAVGLWTLYEGNEV
ncbi:MAG: P-II family nitrogen regulator [Oscillospiraceae bacterium]|jgi:hypothetical protein|nr:P-II family nitrogen regulator [Oscillospiraceae bacterium]